MKIAINVISILLIEFFSINVTCFSQKQVHGFIEIRYREEDIYDYEAMVMPNSIGISKSMDSHPNYFCYKTEDYMNRDSVINKIKSCESLGESSAFLIKNQKPMGYEISENDVNVKELPLACNYYTKSDSRYVYVLYEIEGFACDFELNTKKMLYNEQIMDVVAFNIDRSKPTFIAYYFYDLYFAECVK